MTSPLVTNLLASINVCNELGHRSVLIAELGCYWARTGEFEEADRLRVELRREFSDGRNIRVSIMIMCLEALILYYRELDPSARDRMARASLLSKASKDRNLIALTSAWMAHIDFNLSRFDSMAEEIAACFEAKELHDVAAECRVALVLGDAFLFIGNSTAARRWYEVARTAAVLVGDQAAMGALIYNRAALQVSNVRFAAISQRPADDEINMIRAEVQSAVNYQIIAKHRSLNHLLHRAQIGSLILQAKFGEALALLEKVIESGEVRLGSAQSTLLDSDRVLALAHIGKSQEVISIIDELAKLALNASSADDRALMLSSIIKASDLVGNSQLSKILIDPLHLAIREHEFLVEGLKMQIVRYESADTKAL